jgi:hypothetical protein
MHFILVPGTGLMFTIMRRTLDDLELSSKVHFQRRETPINAILGLQRAEIFSSVLLYVHVEHHTNTMEQSESRFNAVFFNENISELSLF